VAGAVFEEFSDRRFDILECLACRVSIGFDRIAAFASEQLVDGETGVFSEEIPECDVDAAESVVEHGSVAPVGADEGRLPDVLDAEGVFSDQEGSEVVVDGGGDHACSLSERGTSESVEAGLVGVDADDDEADSCRSGQDGSDVGDHGVGSGHVQRLVAGVGFVERGDWVACVEDRLVVTFRGRGYGGSIGVLMVLWECEPG